MAEKKVLTDKQKAFLDALAGPAKGNMREAMKIAGYSDHTMPHDVYSSLSEEIKKIANDLIAANAVKAVYGITGVLDEPAKVGAKEVLSAAKELLDRAGVKKDEANTQIKADAIFILPPKDGAASLDNSDEE